MVALLCVPPAHGDFFTGVGRMFEDWGLFQGMRITGQNTFTLQQHSLEGSKSAFEGQRWDTGSLVQRSSLHIEGPIWRNLGLQADISASGWGRNYQRWVLGWTTDETAIYYGDLNVRLSGNEFAAFNKTMQGWQIDQRIPGGGLLRGFYSQEKGLTRRQTISGNNTSGPFFLRYTPIIEGSEVVKVDEQVMRFGEDYRLDYETGQLRFEPVDGPPRIIPSTSVISVSYQSYGWESSPGEIYGARAEMPLLDDRMMVGVTALRQSRRDPGIAGDTAGYQEDIFQASGTTGPFDVNFRPILPNGSRVVYEGEEQTIDQTVIVLVDNTEQKQGVDYDVYHDIGRIIFRRSVPPTALVRIKYYYDLGQPTGGGDSDVLGLDLGYRINDNLMLRADLAQSSNPLAGGSGRALRGSLAYSIPNLTATLEMRDIQPEFSFIDTVGFQRRERGLNFAAQWQINEHISLYERFSDLRSDSGLSFGYSGYSGYSGGQVSPFEVETAQMPEPSTGLEVHTRRNDLGVDVRYPGWPVVSLSHQLMENTRGASGTSQQENSALSMRYAPDNAPYSVNFNLSNTSQDYRGNDDDNSSNGSRGSSTDQMQVSATYNPMSSLTLAGHFGTNRSLSATSDDRSESTVSQLSARWTPSTRLSVNLDHRRTASDGHVSSGFHGGYGGFSGGGMMPYQIPGIPGGGGVIDDPVDDTVERRGYEDANTRVDVAWRPMDQMNLSLSAGFRDYSSGGGAGYLADSTQSYYNASLGWQPAREWALRASWGSDRQEFLKEGAGAVTNEMLAFGVNYRPKDQPWGLGLNLHRQTGSSPTYIGHGDEQVARMVPTDLFDISGEATYEIGPGISLFGRLGRANFDSGYASFAKDQGEVGVRYRISELADVDVGYRYIRNISGDPEMPLPGGFGGSMHGQDYIAHTFMLGVSTSFASGDVGSGRRGGYTGYGGALSSFGGYSAGYGYGGSDIGDFSGRSTYRRPGEISDPHRGDSFSGQDPFGSGGHGFSAGADRTRGSSAVFQPPTTHEPDGFETGIDDFEEPEQMEEPEAPFGQDGRLRQDPEDMPSVDDQQPQREIEDPFLDRTEEDEEAPHETPVVEDEESEWDMEAPFFSDADDEAEPPVEKDEAETEETCDDEDEDECDDEAASQDDEDEEEQVCDDEDDPEDEDDEDEDGEEQERPVTEDRRHRFLRRWWR